MTVQEPEAPAVVADRAFFGHPRGLAYLAFTEAWERFSFYGMQGLLLLYMLERLFTPAVSGGVVGLAAFRGALESVMGPLSNQAFASQIFGLYSGFVYFTPVFGGLVADRWLGQRRAVMLGAVIMSLGHLLMAFDAGFLVALALLVVGTGLLKGNISAQVGHLYAPSDEARRTRAFAIFSAAINCGALAGPLVCAVLAEVYGWHVGFAAAGVLMLVALFTYVAGRKYLPPDRKRERSDAKRAPLSKREWRIIAALLALMVIGIAPSIAYYQGSNCGILFIDQSVDRAFFRFRIPTAAFNAIDGLFCVVLVPPLLALWRFQAKRGREPGDMGKIAIGYLITALANALMVIPASRADGGAIVSVLWPIALFAVNALGFLYYWPTLLALFSQAAPANVNSTMMGLLFFQNFIGSVLVGTLGGLWEKMSHADFFGLHAALAFVPFVVMLLGARFLERLLADPAGGGPIKDAR
jgi:proton-dependent oligopeptide transporter, POT family